MWYVYLARCSDNSLYCGITNNLEKRQDAHNSGIGSKYTRSRLPVKFVWWEKSFSRSTALKREYQIKRMSKREKESLISDNNNRT